MRDSWLELVDRMLRPARPRLAQCLADGEAHRGALRRNIQARARALSGCRARIEQARAVVLTADDGVVSAGMTELEREWRSLSRFDPDEGMMELWARVAPSSWLDRKRWRHCEPAERVDTAIALAADVDGVERAEAALNALRLALAAWGVPLGALIRWRPFEADVDCVSALLATPLHAAREVLAERSARPLEQASQLERTVLEAARIRFPARPQLARSLAHAAFVECSLQAAAIADRPNPVTALRELWKTGYALAAFDGAGVTLELPPLA